MTNYLAMSKDVKRFVQLPLVYNHWYVAGLSEEFDRTPRARTLLEQSIVFYRTEAGELTALQNRCLHRSFPLSEGYLEGDLLVCGYHGIRYEPSGSITRVPSQRKQCPNRQLRKYAVREQGPFVFIWMGDQDHAGTETAFPELPFLESPSFRTVHGALQLDCSYLLMLENLADLTHFAYLHRETFGIDDFFFDLEFETGKGPEGVYCRFIDTNPDSATRILPPDILKRITGKSVKRFDQNLMFSPGVCKGYAPIFVGDENATDREVFEQFIMHFLTPKTRSTCHYWWSISNNYALNDDDYYTLVKAVAEKGFKEDVWACENMQALLENDSTEFEELSIAGDRAGQLFRHAMVSWVSQEYEER